MTPLSASAAITRFRTELNMTQSSVAQKAGIDQSQLSRIEKGEITDHAEVGRVLDALELLGSPQASEFKKFNALEWGQIEPPSFWNPQRGYLETAEETLQNVDKFLRDTERPWPLRRQIERHRELMLRASTFLTHLNHQIAFVGELGVGKSTAISFIFELLVPPALADKNINRPVLETGAGGTTICEVHVKRGPEFGISLVPLTENEVRQTVGDFCAAKWLSRTTGQKIRQRRASGLAAKPNAQFVICLG